MGNPYLNRVHKDPPLHQESYMGIIELYALNRSHVLPLANQPSITLTQTIKGHLIMVRESYSNRQCLSRLKADGPGC